MAMHFLRYQEHYESPSNRFRNKAFTWIDFMEWYSKKFGKGSFTYPIDWGGFNIPSWVIKYVHQLGISDPNRYDKEMLQIWNKCAMRYPDESFYIIGAVGEKGALQHEIAHGFFYTQPEYKKRATKLVKALPKNLRKKMNTYLKKVGYTAGVYIDETQAYMATGMPDVIKAEKYRKPFVDLYKEFENV
jgi:hypothetical protein